MKHTTKEALNTLLTNRAAFYTRSSCNITSKHLGRSKCSASYSLPLGPARFISSSSSLSNKQRKLYGPTTLIAVASLSAALLTAWQCSSTLHAEVPPKQNTKKDEDTKGEELSGGTKRTFRLSEVSSHNQDSERPWVVKGKNVYDITDWIAGHPGGNVILRAAGGSVEPYWNIFSIHKTQEVYDILEEFLIGHIDSQDLVDGHVPVDSIEDPFVQDPKRDQRLIIHTDKPMNAETPTSLLSTFLTPVDVFYVRNHLWVPRLVEKEHKLVIELDDGEEKEYTMSDLRKNFKQHKITAVLQCSGNRRAHMTEGSRPTNGLQWEAGAIGNAEWTGPRLRDVLADAGFNVAAPPDKVQHAQFVGAEAYGASIPLSKAIDPRGDVILACQMNGKDIPPDHGFPLRVIAPGHVAARSVKWVNRVIMSEEESTSQWQKRDYKCFGPNDTEKPDWDMAPAIQETPVQSAITHMHRKGGKGEAQDVVIEGYAFSGGGRKIIRVDVSTDNGLTWNQAKMDIDPENNGSQDWSWKRWRYTVPEKKVLGATVVVKAVDNAYNGQPESHEPTYNLRGHLTAAWHRVKYDPQKS
ncbi:MAG: hypothetical protein ALECFALPRED_002126 [Alectoria fallacina]|uniref:Nitrate reductase [NADPH] n=1 Tax=Alectoria fallacina TaxID=1903189 RepID=A0A8H3FKG2_9LECA|nr:MAG: hypothetical protein ALECFALPRED_002126 [Alectoria fallacina]